MKKGIIIGFSGKIGSGKTSTSRALGNKLFSNNYKIVSFAMPLKKETNTIVNLIKNLENNENIDDLMTHSFFDSIDKKDAKNAIEIIFDSVKSGDIIDGYTKNPEIRKFYQYWGTQVRRKEDNNYWVKEMDKAISPLIDNGINVLIDDVRFENEAYFILLKKGKLYRLNVDNETRKNRVNNRDGKQTVVNNSHDSETELDNFDSFTNSYTITEKDSVENVVDMILKDFKK